MEGFDRERQLLIDVSLISRSDAKTGIQRVVRNLWSELVRHPGIGFKVKPIFASRESKFVYASADFLTVGQSQNDGPVCVGAGDVFLGLDLSPAILPKREAELKRWKSQGACICVFMYDMLPATNPAWFNRRASVTFKKWLRCIERIADLAICISTDVQAEFEKWLARPRFFRARSTIQTQVLRLAGDLRPLQPAGQNDHNSEILQWAQAGHVALIVGTIEPRKAHRETLAAFDHLWRDKPETTAKLLIVGKPGWKTKRLQRRIASHSEFGRRLMWLPAADDHLLVSLYRACTGVLVPSHAEGFGLPIAEAMHQGKPVLARDLAVVRDFGSEGLTLFDDDQPAVFAATIEKWLMTAHDRHQSSNPGNRNWADAARDLLMLLPYDHGCADYGTSTGCSSAERAD